MAGDLIGALQAARGISSSYYREWALSNVAEANAKDGRRNRAFAILAEIDDRRRNQDDRVLLHLAKFEVRKGRFKRAEKNVQQIAGGSYKTEALVHIAIGRAEVSDLQEAKRVLRRAFDTATSIAYESDRSQGLLRVARAYRKIGDNGAARAAIDHLLRIAETYQDQWLKICAFRNAAVALDEMNERQAAARAFGKAASLATSYGPEDAHHKVNALQLIAIAQAKAGWLDEALATTERIPVGKVRWSFYGIREEAWCAIALEQAKRGNIPAAVKTAMRIKKFMQFNDDALVGIVEIQVRNGHLKGARATALRISNGSEKTRALLIIAAAHARAGDKATAARVAGLHKAIDRYDLLLGVSPVSDRDSPDTPVDLYYISITITGVSAELDMQRDSNLAAAAMTYHLAMGAEPREQYARAFADFDSEILWRLARTQAREGDVVSALRWADRMPSPEARAGALLGVAEGILERKGPTQPAGE